MKKIETRKLIIIVEFVILAVITFLVFYTFTRPERIFNKYTAHKDFETMRPNLEEELALIQDNPSNDTAYYSLGQGFYALEGYDDAIWAFKKAIEIAPNRYYYWSFLGAAYQSRKDYIGARDAYMRALDLDTSRVLTYTKLAWLYYFRLDSEKDKAYEVLKRGLSQFPNDKNLLFDITRYNLYDHNKDEFLKYAPRYLKIDPSYKPISNALKDWRPK